MSDLLVNAEKCESIEGMDEVDYKGWVKTRSKSIPKNLFKELRASVEKCYNQHLLLNPSLGEELTLESLGDSLLMITREHHASWVSIRITLNNKIFISDEGNCSGKRGINKEITGKCFLLDGKYVFRIVVKDADDERILKMPQLTKEILEHIFFDIF